MERTTPKDKLLARIRAEHERWRRLVEDVGSERMEQPGPMGAWTFKDLAAHLTVWRAQSIGQLEAAARSEDAPPNPWPAELTADDDINQWIYQRNRDRPVVDVLADADQSYSRLSQAIAALSEEDVSTPGRFDWTEGAALSDLEWGDHLRQEHEPVVRAWLRQTETAT